MTTNTFYSWREKLVDEDGVERLIIPHGDPMIYEFPIDFVFLSADDAETFIIDHALDWGLEAEETNEWVLVSCTETMVTRK